MTACRAELISLVMDELPILVGDKPRLVKVRGGGGVSMKGCDEWCGDRRDFKLKPSQNDKFHYISCASV